MSAANQAAIFVTNQSRYLQKVGQSPMMNLPGPCHDVAKKPQLASRGHVVAVLVWDAVILLLIDNALIVHVGPGTQRAADA
jgi:hypothetical protein